MKNTLMLAARPRPGVQERQLGLDRLTNALVLKERHLSWTVAPGPRDRAARRCRCRRSGYGPFPGNLFVSRHLDDPALVRHHDQRIAVREALGAPAEDA